MVRFDLPFGHSDWITWQDVHVVEGAEPAFVVTVLSQKDRPIWVRFLIDEIEGDNDCADEFRLDPDSRYVYHCPQARLQKGTEYRADITVFKDFGNTDVAEQIDRLVTLEVTDGGDFALSGRPVD